MFYFVLVQVNSTFGLFYWLEHTVFPRFFPETYYNGNPLPVLDKLYFGDLENYRIGPGRLRQVRMKKGLKCFSTC